MEKCKKHNRKVVQQCNSNHYDDECDCIPKCAICIQVQKTQYKKTVKGSNLVIEVGPGVRPIDRPTIYMMKYKPRHKLPVGIYATLDIKTGYIIKATTTDVRYLVVR